MTVVWIINSIGNYLAQQSSKASSAYWSNFMESTKKGAAAFGSYCAEMWEDAKSAGAHALKAAPYAAIIAAAPIIVSAADVKAAEPNYVPLDFRIKMDFSDLQKINVRGYDSVQQIGGYAKPWGAITFQSTGGNVPAGWRIWFFDEGKKPSNWDPNTPFPEGRQIIGRWNTTGGGYTMNDINGLRGKDSNPFLDQGAISYAGSPQEFVWLVAEDENSRFFRAYWSSGTMLTTGFKQLADGKHNIVVTSEEYVPQCGDMSHPYPEGDINKDCIVDETDLLTLSSWWLQDCNSENNYCGGADIQIDELNMVNFSDYLVQGKHWKECTSPN